MKNLLGFAQMYDFVVSGLKLFNLKKRQTLATLKIYFSPKKGQTTKLCPLVRVKRVLVLFKMR